MSESDAVGGTTTRWREAGERADPHLAMTCVAADISIVSPLTARFRFEGRDQARDMLVAAYEVISDLRFHTEVGDDHTRALFYDGRCGTQEFEEAQLLRFDRDGLITELTLFGRPLPGLTAVMAAIGPTMLRQKGRRVAAAGISAAVAPIAALTRVGERRIVPIADPNRPGRRTDA